MKKPRILEVDVIENKFIVLFDSFNATLVHNDNRTEAHNIKSIYQVIKIYECCFVLLTHSFHHMSNIMNV